jgi:hypothetical protein
MMQISRMVEMGLSAPAVFAQCEKAGDYRTPCVQSAGRDLSNFVRVGDALGTARTCELASGDDRPACVRGVVYALIDNTWDGRYALPFCAALIQAGDQESCFWEGVGTSVGFDNRRSRSPANALRRGLNKLRQARPDVAKTPRDRGPALASAHDGNTILPGLSPFSARRYYNLPRLLIVDDEMSVRVFTCLQQGFSCPSNSLDTAVPK